MDRNYMGVRRSSGVLLRTSRLQPTDLRAFLKTLNPGPENLNFVAKSEKAKRLSKKYTTKHACKNCNQVYSIHQSYGIYACTCHPGIVDYRSIGSDPRWTCCGRTAEESLRWDGCTRCEHIPDFLPCEYGTEPTVPAVKVPLGLVLIALRDDYYGSLDFVKRYFLHDPADEAITRYVRNSENRPRMILKFTTKVDFDDRVMQGPDAHFYFPFVFRRRRDSSKTIAMGETVYVHLLESAVEFTTAIVPLV